MTLFNVVSQMKDLNRILRDLIVMGFVEFKNSFEDIDESNFSLTMMKENADEIVELLEINHCEKNSAIRTSREKLEYILSGIEFKPTVEKRMMVGDYTFAEVEESINRIHDHFRELTGDIDKYRSKLEELDILNCDQCLNGINVDLKKLINLENFIVKWGYLTQENRHKIEKNYENISAAVLHLGSDKEKEVYMVISPKELELETDRILRSVNFFEIKPATEFFDYPDIMFKKMDNERKRLKTKLKDLAEVSKKYLEDYHEEINQCYSRIIMHQKIDDVKEKLAVTKNFVYMSVWIPENETTCMEKYFEVYGDTVILARRDIKDLSSSVIIPTKLRNNILFKPFEELVLMYGIPSYNEIDPTVFFALSYMLLFGAMFGDLGQGLVIFLAGLYISKKNRNYGGILSRIGLSSMIFGFVYDSFFGYENVISKFIPGFKYLRPIENINTILITSIGVGIVLLTISYIFSIINKLKRKEIEEGVFGRTGVAGLVLFSSVLLLAYEMVMKVTHIPIFLLIALTVFSVGMIVGKEPISNLILKQRPIYHENASQYYIESGFDIFETFLSLFSNSVSFIRVGAFALNHVGLFIAFHTMASIIGNLAGNISMFFIGNVMIIFLEGLVVFIQGLRLVYYEMFSKYYTGEGILFEPDRIIEEALS